MPGGSWRSEETCLWQCRLKNGCWSWLREEVGVVDVFLSHSGILSGARAGYRTLGWAWRL